jgi:tetratricopeptide (TPR) repeat protein
MKTYDISFFLEILSQMREVLGTALLWWFRAFLFLEWFLGSLNTISDIAFNLLKIGSFLLLLFLMILLARRVFKKEKGLVIVPFETSGNEQGKYNGKLVSDLLTGELQRILKVHGHKFEEISITAENLSIPDIVPKGETLDYSIADMGTVGNGSATLSIGSLIVAFKRLCPGSEPVPILTGSLGCFGSLIELAASLEGRKIQAWEVRHGPKAGEPAFEECIPGLIRDLSFKIAFDLALADPRIGVSAKTWRGFMHFTEALEAYYNYMQTGNAKDLRRSKRSCIKAVYSEKEYNKAVEMLGALGFVYAEKKDYHMAQKIFNIVSKFKMDLGSFGLGFVFELINENENALDAYDRAIEINPQNSDAWNNKGVSLGKLNRLNDALVAFDRAIELNPKYFEALYNKGLALGKLERLEDALTAYDRAIELNPQDSDAWNNKGSALVKLDRSEEGLVAFDRAIELNSQRPKVWYNKGVALVKLDRSEEGLVAFDRAIELNPLYSEAWNNKGIALGKLDLPENALFAFDKAIELNPQGSNAWYGKGSALKLLHRETEAGEAFSRAKVLGFTGASET